MRTRGVPKDIHTVTLFVNSRPNSANYFNSLQGSVLPLIRANPHGDGAVYLQQNKDPESCYRDARAYLNENLSNR